MSPLLYYLPISPPCRSVMLLAQIIGLVLDMQTIDIMKGEQMTEEFIMINPQHTIPTLVDGDLILWESRAIMTYLSDKYAANDSLYPHDVGARALVDQRMQFDLGTLYQRMTDYYFPTLFAGTAPEEAKWTKLATALGFLEEMLRDRVWTTGQTYTLADVTLTVTVAHIEVFGADLGQYKRVSDWLERSKNVLRAYKYDEIMTEPMQMMSDIFKANLPK